MTNQRTPHLVTVHNEDKRVDRYEFISYTHAISFVEKRTRHAKLKGIVFVVWIFGAIPDYSSVSVGGGDEWIGEDIMEDDQ